MSWSTGRIWGGHFWDFLLKKLEIEYVREYSPKIWPEIWYSTSILGSWNSHWIILDLRNRPTVAWRKKNDDWNLSVQAGAGWGSAPQSVPFSRWSPESAARRDWCACASTMPPLCRSMQISGLGSWRIPRCVEREGDSIEKPGYQ